MKEDKRQGRQRAMTLKGTARETKGCDLEGDTTRETRAATLKLRGKEGAWGLSVYYARGVLKYY